MPKVVIPIREEILRSAERRKASGAIHEVGQHLAELIDWGFKYRLGNYIGSLKRAGSAWSILPTSWDWGFENSMLCWRSRACRRRTFSGRLQGVETLAREILVWSPTCVSGSDCGNRAGSGSEGKDTAAGIRHRWRSGRISSWIRRGSDLFNISNYSRLLFWFVWESKG